ncbi:MAG: hypothetical protein J3Q66DRAFT_334528 [Benniella sp.]|nr:MAG: hypothetical protein J3Q66DRAFT_334528 [Benniella sp.]
MRIYLSVRLFPSQKPHLPLSFALALSLSLRSSLLALVCCCCVSMANVRVLFCVPIDCVDNGPLFSFLIILPTLPAIDAFRIYRGYEQPGTYSLSFVTQSQFSFSTFALCAGKDV